MTDSQKTKTDKPAPKRQQPVDDSAEGFTIGLGDEAMKSYVPPENGIGERIRLKRAETGGGLSVEDLSRVCKDFDPEGKGISRLALSRYEAGKFIPGARELRILCDALAVTPNWLLTGREMAAWPPETHDMLEAVARWVESLQGRKLHALLEGRPDKDDWHRAERIKRAIAKTPPKPDSEDE